MTNANNIIDLTNTPALLGNIEQIRGNIWHKRKRK